MPARAPTPAFVRKLGARIRALRLEAGVTLEKLAERAGLDKATLSRVERGSHAPSMGNLKAIADALKVLPMDLLATSRSHPRVQLLDAARQRPERVRAAIAVLRT